MPPHLSYPLRLGFILLVSYFSLPHHLSAQTPAAPAQPAAAAPKAPGTYARMIALWADVPAYHDRLTSNSPGPRKPAQLISAFSPPSPFPLPEGTEIKVNVALVISDTGQVEAARILDSTDARFNQVSLDAVKQWLFRPALGDEGPRIAFTVAPIVFQGAPAPAPRHIKVGFSGWSQVNVSGWFPDGNVPRFISGHLAITQDGGRPIRAGRIVITRAQDDTGRQLVASSKSEFYANAVGSISAADNVRNPPPSFEFTLTAPAPTATKVASLDGTLELVIPDLDPNATATVEKAAATFGSPVRSAALRAQGVTLTLMDKIAADAFATANPQPDSLAGPSASVLSQHSGAAGLDSNKQVHDGDLAVRIADPQNRLVGLEFQTADGQPLRYDHNGWYHAANPAAGTRLDIYALKLPPDARLVCWLITDKSLQKLPFKLSDLKL